MATNPPSSSSNLNNQTSLSIDAFGNITDILFSGGNVNLSDLTGQFPASGGQTLTIYADTLVVDNPMLNVHGLTIVARILDITSLGQQPWYIQPINGASSVMIECLVQRSIAGGANQTLVFTGSGTSNPQANEMATVSTNNSDYSTHVAKISIATNGLVTQTNTSSSDFADLLLRPYALNTMYSTFSAACTQISSSGQSLQNSVFSQLNWICGTLQNCGALPQTHAGLFGQASALLNSISIPPSYHYLGVLSQNVYSTQISDQINILNEYYNSLGIVQTQGAVQSVLTSVSAAMSATANAELAPTQTQFAQVSSSINSLYSQLSSLANDIQNQMTEIDGNLALLKGDISNSQATQFLMNSIQTTFDAVGALASIGASVSAGGSGAGQAVAATVTTMKDAVATIQGLTATYNTGNLISDATTLVQQIQQLSVNSFVSQQLWFQVNNGTYAGATFNPAPLTFDPNVAWSNFMASVTQVLSNLNASFPSGGSFSSAQAQSNIYLESLKKLANLGIAFNTQQIAYSQQLCQGIVLLGKINSIKATQSIWTDLCTSSENINEQYTALVGLINDRINATRRSIFIAWINYRSAYLYNMLVEPPEAVTLDMAPGLLSSAFSSINTWINGIPASGGTGSTKLPNQNARIQVTVPVITQSGSNPNTLSAFMRLTPTDTNYAGNITLTIPNTPNLFSAQIGKGNVAIWITASEFDLTGINPNSSGYVPMLVGTSGSYSNGYQSSLLYFVTQPLSSNFSYQPLSTGGTSIVVPWSVNSELYMLPTPFTTWTFFIDNGCDLSVVNEITVTFTANVQFQ